MSAKIISRTKMQVTGITKVTYESGGDRYLVAVKNHPQKMFSTYALAKAHRAEIAKDVAEGIKAPTGGARTVEQACAAFLLVKKPAVEQNTIEGYESALIPVRQEFVAMPLRDLTVEHLAALVAKLAESGYPRSDGQKSKPWRSGATNYTLKILGMVLKFEMKQGRLRTNVAALVDRRPKDTRVGETLTEAQVKHLLSSCTFDRDLIAYRLALMGLRRGEIAGLRWDHIDMQGRTLKIEEARVQTRSAIITKGPKSRSGKRLLPMPEPLVAELKRVQHRQTKEKLQCRGAYSDGGYVVADEAGRPYRPELINDHWKKMLKCLGLPSIHLHDARHTCGTLMGLSGEPQVLIMAWLGHADLATTAIYVHSQDDALAAMVNTRSLNLG